MSVALLLSLSLFPCPFLSFAAEVADSLRINLRLQDDALSTSIPNCAFALIQLSPLACQEEWTRSTSGEHRALYLYLCVCVLSVGDRPSDHRSIAFLFFFIIIILCFFLPPGKAQA